MHTDSIIRKTLQQPGTAQSFMIYHPALSYFARDYGLQQISIEEGGKDVRIIFIQPEFDRRNAEIIARETGTGIVPINPLSYNWEAEMLTVAQALTDHNKK